MDGTHFFKNKFNHYIMDLVKLFFMEYLRTIYMPYDNQLKCQILII